MGFGAEIAEKEKKKKKKVYLAGTSGARKADAAVAGFFGNAWDELRGLPQGFFSMGKTVVHDAGTVIGTNDDEFQSDDMLWNVGKALKESYWSKKSPYWQAAHGNWGKAGELLYERPLGPALDVATVLTLGGAALGKGAQVGAQSSRLGKSARLAPLANVMGKTSGMTRRTPEAEANAVAAGIPIEAYGAFIPKARPYTIKKGGIETAPIFKPFERNPMIRSRNDVFRGISRAPVISSLPLIGQSRRLSEFERKRMGQREMRTLDEIVDPAESATYKVTTAERKALAPRAAGLTLAQYVRMLKEQADEVPEGTPEAVQLKAKLKIYDNKKALKADANPSRRLQQATEQMQESGLAVREMLQKLGIHTADEAEAARFVPMRVESGARPSEFHPDLSEATPGAKAAQARLEREVERLRLRAEGLEGAADDLTKFKPPLRATMTREATDTEVARLWNRKKTELLNIFNPTLGIGRVQGLDVVKDMANDQSGNVATPSQRAVMAANASADAGGSTKGGGKKVPGREIAERALWHHLEGFANDEPMLPYNPDLPNSSFDNGNYHQEHHLFDNDPAERAAMFESVGITKEAAEQLVRHRNRKDALERNAADDHFTNPKSPFYDPDDVPDVVEVPDPINVVETAPQWATEGTRRKMAAAALRRRRRAMKLRVNGNARTRDLALRAGVTQPVRAPDVYGGASVDELAAAVEGPGPIDAAPIMVRAGKRVDTKVADAENFLKGAGDISALAAVGNMRSAVQVASVQAKMQRMLELATEVPVGEVIGKKGWKVLDADAITDIKKAKQGQAQFNQLKKELENAKDMSARDRKDLLNAFREAYTLNPKRDLPESGMVKMVPDELYNAMVGQYRKYDRRIDWPAAALDKPTAFFKAAVLKTVPKWHIANIIGNHTLLAVKDPTPAMIGVLAKTYLHQAGTGAANAVARRRVGQFVLRVDRTKEYKTAWSNALDQIGEVKSSSMGMEHGRGAIARKLHTMNKATEGNAVSRSVLTRKVAGILHAAVDAPNKLTELSSVLSDDLPRQVRFRRIMQPYIKQAKKQPKFKGMKSAEIAEQLLKNNDKFADRIARQVLDDLIDYKSLSPVETGLLRRAIPFYSWFKGISTWSAKVAADEPHKFLVALQVGAMGKEQIEEAYGGEVPGYALNQIIVDPVGPLKGGQGVGPSVRALRTASFNPWATMGDLAGAARNLYKGEERPVELFGMLNPVYQSVHEAMSGRTVFSDSRLVVPGTANRRDPVTGKWDPQRPGYGFPGAFANQFFGDLPLPTLLALKKQGGSSANAMRQSDFKDYVREWMGVPITNYNIQRTRAKVDKKKEGERYAR